MSNFPAPPQERLTESIDRLERNQPDAAVSYDQAAYDAAHHRWMQSAPGVTAVDGDGYHDESTGVTYYWRARPVLAEQLAKLEKPDDRSTIAAEAQAAVYGERGKDYGHPSVNFADAAALWTVLLKDRLSDGQPLTAEDVARCMIGIKLARDIHSPKRDNRVDIIGYAISLDRIETGQ